MSKRIATSLLLAAGLVALPAFAQAPAPAPSGGLPARAPFDIPYGMPISLANATQALAAAEAEAAKHGWPEAIAVVDPSGGLVTFAKMDDTQNASPLIALRKAKTAAGFRRDSQTFYTAFETGHSYSATLEPGLAASPGGIPLVMNGKIVGALGCSGGTGDQDQDICRAGANALK